MAYRAAGDRRLRCRCRLWQQWRHEQQQQQLERFERRFGARRFGRQG
jgi:hypothetical protein